VGLGEGEAAALGGGRGAGAGAGRGRGGGRGGGAKALAQEALGEALALPRPGVCDGESVREVDKLALTVSTGRVEREALGQAEGAGGVGEGCAVAWV
jgi:hypothetical protein